MIVLEAEELIKIYNKDGNDYDTKALDRINLKIEKGEFLAIMGPSGSGKTTLLNVLSGIDKPTSGEVKIAGKSISSMSRNDLAFFRRNHLGFVFQEFNMLDSLTVKENILLPMILDNKEAEEMEAKADEVMSMLGIKSIADKYPCKTSGGQQQRTAIGRAVINKPDMIFADEPTGNLDSKSAKEVMSCFENINRINSSTILLVTHDPFTASHCNRVVFIKDGRINMEIEKKTSSQDFLERILDCLSIIGEEKCHEL